jgi:hypothetical protein
MSDRIAGFDLIRSVSFLLIFLYHIVNRQVTDPAVLLIVKTAAVIAVSLLGFISSVLLSEKNIGSGTFLLRRLTRIYIPLVLCLTTMLTLHALIGKTAIGQHALLHLLGATAFFYLLGVKSNATIGHGLWFVTTIIGMYFLLPVLHQMFRKPAGFRNLVGVAAACTVLNYALAGTENIFTIVITFSLGVYLGASRQIEGLLNMKPFRIILFAISMFALLSTMIWIYDAWHPLPQLIASLSPLAFVPLFFAAAPKLPKFFISGSALFAGLSYEFYILHFYFINEGFHDFFKLNVGLFGHILIAFAIVSVLSLVLSRIGSFLVGKANLYLCGPRKESEEKEVCEKPYSTAVPVVKS